MKSSCIFLFSIFLTIAAQLLTASISAQAPPQSSVISGLSTVCQGNTGVTYSVTNEPGTTYLWTYSGNGFIKTAGDISNSITVLFSDIATSGNLSVVPCNVCGNGPPRTLALNVATANTTISNAGSDIVNACGVNSATFSGNNPNVGSGLWIMISGQGTITSPTSPSSGITGLGIGPNIFRWTISNGTCLASTDDVIITANDQASIAAANVDQTVCASSATLDGNIPSTGIGLWTKVFGIGTITSPSSPSSTVTGLITGSVTFRWTISNAPCVASSDDVVITRNGSTTIANAGADQTVCAATATLAGNTPTAGTGSWTLISGTATITSPSAANSGITGLAVGTSVFRWTISNAPCTATSDDISITRSDNPTTAAAGADQTVCATTATLAGNAATVGTGSWTLVSGTGTITTSSSPTSGLTGLGVGANVFRWTISNAPCTATSDDISITRSDNPTVAAAGADQTICAATATLAGNAATVGTGSWTLVSGAGTITTSSSPTSGVTGLGVGANVFRWTISNAPCTATSDDISITRSDNPTTAAAGADQTVCATTATLAGNAATVGTGSWTLVSGAGTITTSSSPTSGITGLGVGPNVFRWTITNVPCTATSDDISITRSDNSTTANAGADQLICATTATLAGNTATVGTGSWTLVSGTGTITTSSSPTSGITGLGVGANVFRWTISNAPCTATSDDVSITRSDNPTTATAGADQTVCATTATLAGNAATVGTGSWTLVSGAGTITTSSSPTSGVTGLGVGANVFRWTISNAPCTATSDDISITRSDNPTTAAAGADQTVCATTATLAGNAATVGTGSWTLVSGAGTITTSSSPTSGVTGLGVGANVFRWTITNAPCTATSDDITITRSDNPTTATAGTDINQTCGLTTATLAGNAATVGTGAWSLISGTATISTPSSPTSCITGLAVPGIATLRWTISNTPCTASTDDVIITTTSFCCGGTLAITHTSGTVAPETKSVNYGTVTSSLSGASKCWITQNLGSTNQGSSATDNTDASAGWYWQFNRKLGYKVGPTPAWTITAISEASDWLEANDPCTIELGTGWRIPTKTEWTNADANGLWANYTDTYNSVLKLHAAGYLNNTSGSLSSRGTFGGYWCSSQITATNGWFLRLITSLVLSNDKANGYSLRCLRDTDASDISVATAGTDQTVCAATATLAGNTATVGTGLWTLVSGTGTITTSSSPTSGITGLGVGANVFRWTISNAPCTATSDDISITRSDNPTSANAGADQTVCAATATLAGNTATVGTGSWTLVSGTGTITSSSSPTSGITGLGVGANVFGWTISNAPCNATSDAITITRSDIPTTAAAGADQTVCAATATLAGNTATVGAGSWTLVSGAGTITTSSSPTSGITGLGVGANVFRWTISNAPCTATSDDIIITRSDNPTAANAGADQTICATTATLAGNTATVGTGSWTLVSGTGTITSSSSPTSGITGLGVGANVFRWTISNAPCTATSDDITITRSDNPTAANAGADQTICATTATLAGNTATVGTGSWTLVSGTGTITSSSSPTSGITGLGVGANVFRWTISNAPCTATSDDITITRSDNPTAANAGADQTICATTATLAGNTATVGTGSWTLVSGAGTITTSSSPTSGITGLGVGANVFRWTISNAPCTATSDDITITRSDNPTAANAGADQTVCAATATLAGNTATVGTGSWTLVSGAGTITTSSSPTSGITGLGVGANVFRWTISNAPCTATSDDITITRSDNPTSANAGADQTICATTDTLAGNTATVGTGSWTLVSGAGTITTSSSPTSGLTGLGVGANVFRWTITNAPCAATSDDVTITRSDNPTAANAGADQTVCATSATLAGNTATVGTGSWTLVSGAGTITTSSSPTSGITGLGVGANVFRWTISNAPCTATSDDITITRSDNPTSANAGADQTICATTDTLAGNTATVGTGSWTLVSGAGTITTSSSPTSGLTGLGVGANVFRWTISNAPCTATSDDITITRSDNPTAANAGADQTVCATSATLAGNTATVGTGSWTLVSGAGTITTSSSPTSGITGLGVGANVFRWTISNAPCTATSDDITITRSDNPTAANAGADQTICATTATLAGNTATVGTGSWTLVSGAGTITTSSSPTSGITGLGVGANVFRWTISNAPCTATSDDITITRSDNPTTAAAGADQTVCATSATLAGNTATVGTGSWTLVSGAGTITTSSSPTSGVTGLGVGANVFRWTISNAPCTATSDAITITRSDNPTAANAGADQTICATTATLAGNTATVGTGSWTLVSGAGTITTSSSPTSGITGLGVGANVFRWTISNAPCTATSDDISITRSDNPTVAAAGADINPACGITTATLSANTPTVGTGAWSVISGTAIVTSASSPTSSVTGLAVPGTATLRWTISNAPCTASTDDVVITTIACCPSTIAITHTIGLVAPENKSVTYGVVTSSLSGASKCWITQNLGSTNQGSSATDITDASAGWYWQFNRKQGYKVGPTPAWTITSIIETSDWLAANDPCTIELGAGWRIPTYTEWFNADANGPWANYTDTYNSVLKLHAAGYLSNANGLLANRGTYGYYWSSAQRNSNSGWLLFFSSGSSDMNFSTKAYGFSVRCLRD